MGVVTAVSIFQQLLPEPEAGLLSGIVFGVKNAIDPSILELFITTGTVHITALSGFNITIIEVLAATLLQKVFSRRISSLLSILFIIGFVWYVGISASVVRAAIMGSLALLSVVFGRQKQALWFLTITSFGMIIVQPVFLTDIGFLLSVGATLGIILFSTRWAKMHQWEKRFPRVINACFSLIREDLATSLAANVFTVPIILLLFHQISFIAPVTNILIGWAIAPITVLGLFTALVGSISLTLAQPLSWICYVLLHYVLAMVTLTASVPFAHMKW